MEEIDKNQGIEKKIKKEKAKTDYDTPFYRELYRLTHSQAPKVCSLSAKNNFHQNSVWDNQSIQYRLREILKTTGNIDIAIQELQKYVEEQKKKWLLFRDEETGQHLLVRYKNRFSPEYVAETKKKLKFLQKLPENYILHWVLTIPNTDVSYFMEDYDLLKRSFCKWMKELKKVYLQKYEVDIRYVVTYETTMRKGQLHQHLHCIILGIRYVPHGIFIKMKNLWQRLTGSQYDHLTIPRQKENIFKYIMKYVTKEISSINITSMFLFLTKGKAFTMSLSLSQLFEEEKGSQLLPQHKYIFLGVFQFDEINNPFFVFDRYNIDSANQTYVLIHHNPQQIVQWREWYDRAKKEEKLIEEVEKKARESKKNVEVVKITSPTKDQVQKIREKILQKIEEYDEVDSIPRRPSIHYDCL